MDKRGRSEVPRRSSAEAQSSKGDESDDSAGSRGSGKRGKHGARGLAGDTPAFMQLSGEQAAHGRRSRSGSRSGSNSRSPSPAGGVKQGTAALSMHDVQIMAEEHLERLVHGDSGAGEARAEDLTPYGNRCYWCLSFEPDHPKI